MRKSFYIILIALIVGSAFADTAAPVQKEVAIVHFSRLKEKKLDGNATGLQLAPIMGRPGQTPYFMLRNELPDPRTVTVSILDLTEPEYDLYVSAKFIGTKKKAQIESGIPVSFSGTLIPPAYKDYYSRIKSRSLEGAKRFEGATDKDGSICQSVLKAVGDWVNSIERGDLTIRTESIIVAPTGKPLNLAGTYIMPDKPKEFPKKMRHLGEAIHIMRRDISRKVKNQIFLADSLEALTPVDFELTPTGPITPGNKITIRASLTNWTDRLITGKISLSVPSGWRMKPIVTDVKMPGYSQHAVAKFVITIPKTAKPDPSITATADLLVQDVKVMLRVTGMSYEQ